MKQPKIIPTIFCAYFFSLMGDSLFKIAFPLFIYKLTDSSVYTSFTYATQYLPYVLIMPFMGGLVDRVSKKRLLLCTDGLSTLFMTILALYSFLVLRLQLPILPLFLFLFLVVALDTVNHPAFHAFVPRLISPSTLPKINSGMGIMSNSLSVLGALLGGVLIVAIGAVPVFWMNALSFVLSFALILLLPKDEPHHANIDTNAKSSEESISNKKRSPFTDLQASVRYTFSHPIARFFTIFHFFSNIGSSLIHGGIIYYLAGILGLSGTRVGFIMGVSGLGSVVGSFVTPFLMKRIKNGFLFIGTAFFMAVTVLSFVWAHSAGLALLSLFLLSLGTGVIVVLTFTMRQQHIPQQDLGKVITISRPVSFVPIPIASMIAGYVLGHYGSIVPLAIIGFCVLFFSALVGMKSQFVSITNARPHKS